MCWGKVGLLALGIALPLAGQWCEVGRAAALNSAADDFAPVWDRWRGYLLLSSTRQGESRIYRVAWQDTNWGTPQPLLSVSGHHLSYAAPLPTGNLYVCRYRLGRRQAYLHIVEAVPEVNGQWRWQELPALEAEEAFTMHPTVSPDGRVLIFASTRASGRGGTDLWICYRQGDGSWSVPQNLRELNSPGNEITPHLAAADTLYFASNGHGGAGGYDLFISVRGWDGRWSDPEPLVGLNTAADESDFCLLPGSHKALFVRGTGVGTLDIFTAQRCLSLPVLPSQDALPR